jgi:hypothetical protein
MPFSGSDKGHLLQSVSGEEDDPVGQIFLGQGRLHHGQFPAVPGLPGNQRP